MTYLCVPISAPTFDASAAAMSQAEAGGAELLELRLDLLASGAANALPPLAHVPILATCRDRAEGGSGNGDDLARAAVLCAAIRAGAAFVDFELAAWNRSPKAARVLRTAIAAKAPNRKANCRLILSAHDFGGRLQDVGRLLEQLWASPADIVKIAYKANRITDCFDALDALHASRHHKPTIALAMGQAGTITRLLAKKLGAFCTFAALGEGQGTAPGQPTLAEFKTLYRWDHIGPATEVFGVIGWPIAHSMSPPIHNAAFDATSYDGLYLPMLVEPDQSQFEAFLDGLHHRMGWLDLCGLSVTIPHKEDALRFVRGRGGQVEPLAERIGAVNTIRFESEAWHGRPAHEFTGGTPVPLAGRNTDYAAALDAVCAALGCDRAGLAGRNVAVLGAGGAARAIIAGFADAGARVIAFNRTVERAERLASEFGCEFKALNSKLDVGVQTSRDARAFVDAEVIVNATSVGMHPNVDQSPLPAGAIRAGQLVFDTVYNPIRTRLIDQAEQRGAITITGVEMFVRQAVAQFEWWTGLPAPAEVMRKIVMDRLTAR